MTEEFAKKMREAIEKGVLVTKKLDEEHLKKVADNQEYANYYMALVIAAIETFDYYEKNFVEDKLDEDVLKTFGKPREITILLDKKDDKKILGTATIYLNYGKDGGFGRVGEPKFKKDKKFDYSIINEILAENGISVRETNVDGGGYGSEDDCITFDATALLEKSEELIKEKKAAKKFVKE